jgi:hypothetical protein
VKSRSWRSRLIELLLWLLVAIATAVVLVIVSERFFPPNF